MPDRTHPLTHRACVELLPWLLNGTLDDGERETVAAHLERCESCQEELRELRGLRDAVGSQPEPAAAGSLAAVRERAAAARALPFRRPAAALRWVVAAQAAAIAALLAALLWPGAPAAPEAFRTLADPLADLAGAVAAPGPALRVVFDAGSSIAEVSRLLDGAGAQIVHGPNAAGAFTVRPRAAGADLEALEGLLRGDPRVRLVERAAIATP